MMIDSSRLVNCKISELMSNELVSSNARSRLCCVCSGVMKFLEGFVSSSVSREIDRRVRDTYASKFPHSCAIRSSSSNTPVLGCLSLEIPRSVSRIGVSSVTILVNPIWGMLRSI